MTARRKVIIAAFILIGVLLALGVVGFVTADQLGGFAIIAALVACLAIPVPMLLFTFAHWAVEQSRTRAESSG